MPTQPLRQTENRLKGFLPPSGGVSRAKRRASPHRIKRNGHRHANRTMGHSVYANDNPVRNIDPDGRDSFSVARPAYKYAQHTFVVVADKPGGKIRAEFHYGPSGHAIQTFTTGSKLVSLTGTNSETALTDAQAFKALSNPSAATAAGITVTKINATDNSVIAAGNAVNQVVGTVDQPGNVAYKPLPIRLLDSSPGNSNSAAAAVVDMAQASSGNQSTGRDNPAFGSGAAQNIEDRIPIKSCGTRVCSN